MDHPKACHTNAGAGKLKESSGSILLKLTSEFESDWSGTWEGERSRWWVIHISNDEKSAYDLEKSTKMKHESVWIQTK